MEEERGALPLLQQHGHSPLLTQEPPPYPQPREVQPQMVPRLNLNLNPRPPPSLLSLYSLCRTVYGRCGLGTDHINGTWLQRGRNPIKQNKGLVLTNNTSPLLPQTAPGASALNGVRARQFAPRLLLPLHPCQVRPPPLEKTARRMQEGKEKEN